MMSPYIIDAAPLIPKATLDAALSSSNADKALDQGRISPRAHTTFTDALT